MTQAWVQPLVYSLDSPILKKIEDVFDGIFICTGKVSLIHNNYSKKKPSSNVLNVTKDMFSTIVTILLTIWEVSVISKIFVKL